MYKTNDYPFLSCSLGILFCAHRQPTENAGYGHFRGMYTPVLSWTALLNGLTLFHFMTKWLLQLCSMLSLSYAAIWVSQTYVIHSDQKQKL